MVLIVNTKTREFTGKKVKTLREQNLIPAVVYGKDAKPQNLVLEYLPFERVFREAGESSLIDLKINDSAPVKVLIHGIQKNPTSGKFIHIDFWQVKMTEKITAEIELKFVGESPAVKELGGVLIKSLDKIKVECLPQDLIHEIDVDISSLKTFEDLIHIKDLKIPAGIRVLDNPEEAIATITPPRTEEELAELEAKPEEKIEEVEVVEKKEEKEEKETETEK
jgi:large subunit ribosomal protein L25